MYTYDLFNLNVESDLKLPELFPAESAPPDVQISPGDVKPVSESETGENGRYISVKSNMYRLTYSSIGSFRVESGRRIIFDPIRPATVEQRQFRQLIINEIMGLLLHQRGNFVIHASAVAVDGKAVLFLGPSGVGKSTTAAAFYAEGYTVLSEDVTAIRWTGDTPHVLPGVPQLRLTPDAVTKLGLTVGGVSDDSDHKQYVATGSNSDSIPLDGLYVLRESDRLALEPIEGHDQMLTLVTNTYPDHLLTDSETTTGHFDRCSRIVENSRFAELYRPTDYGALQSLVELVASDLHSASQL